ncbi:MAG: UDP-glucose--hexose-1-phosphate uridylyltransferase [Candidatus Scatovivens sp.]
MEINKAINELIKYGLENEILYEEDKIYSINQLLNLLNLEEFHEEKIEEVKNIEEILKEILDYAVENKIIEEDTIKRRDLFDTKIMNCIMPRPSQVIQKFREEYKKSPENATEFYYKFSKATDYIRTYRVKKDLKWKTDTKYGTLDITINLSKPEKDPKDIILLKQQKQISYPKCVICKEAEGFKGRINSASRDNHRIIPIKLNGEEWFFQYSPYSYYNEHCIILNGNHVPMKIDKTTFEKLFDFINQFPHYMIGSNAGLPVVGGSILTHEHYQGGKATFPMDKAEYIYKTKIKNFDNVEFGILNWPLSVIRIRSKNYKELIELGDLILRKWKEYSDYDSGIYAYTENTPHNTITPIARKNKETYELDLVLRNNLTTEEYPLGVFHPHPELHHIKKENIGLIEVMGLAILPARLKEEMEILSEYLLENKDISQNDKIKKHELWAKEIKNKYSDINKNNIEDILHEEIGLVFEKVLEDAGVFKTDEKGIKAFKKFIDELT